jgi:zinc protease
MPDRTLPPSSYPIDLDTLQFPDVHSFQQGTKGLVIRDPLNEVVILEVVLNSGKIREEQGGESFFALKMLSEGTSSKSSEEIAYLFEAKGSYLELSPGQEYSSIKIYALKEHFGETIDLLHQILTDASFEEKSFNLLKDIRMASLANQLSRNNRFATMKFNEMLFGPEHPMGRMITPDRIEAMNLDVVKGFAGQRLFVDPKIVLAGNVGTREIELVDQLMQSLVVDNRTALQTPEVRPQAGIHNINRNKDQASLRWGAATISYQHEDIHSLRISNSLFGGFFGSRLMMVIREEKGLTYGIYSTIVTNSVQSYWLISSEMNKELIEEGSKAINEEMNRLATSPPEAKELEVLKNYLKGKILMSQNSLYGKINYFKNLLIHDLSPDYLRQYWGTLDTIAPEDVTNMVNKYFVEPEIVKLVVS